MDFVATDLHQMVASYSAARTVLFDLETGQPVLNLDSATTYGKYNYCGTVGILIRAHL